jgi:hypothetical protein
MNIFIADCFYNQDKLELFMNVARFFNKLLDNGNEVDEYDITTTSTFIAKPYYKRPLIAFALKCRNFCSIFRIRIFIHDSKNIYS